MNRLLRARSVGSLGSLEDWRDGDAKYSKLHKSRQGRLSRLPSCAPLLLVAVLVVCAFFAAQSVAPRLPSTKALPELDEQPRISRVALENMQQYAVLADQGAAADGSGELGGKPQQQRRQQQEQQQQQRAAGRSEPRPTGEQQQGGDVQQEQLLRDTAGLGAGGVHALPRRRQRRKTKYTPSLKQDVDDLILEAAEVAKMHGIVTEADAAEGLDALEEEGAGEAGELGIESLLKATEQCTPAFCTPHGACINGRCQCVPMYTGKRCGHGVFLSRPFLPEGMRQFSAGFEGELVLHQGTAHTELKVYHPPNPGEAGTGPSAYSVVADAAALRRLLPLLPAKDTILKGRAYESCAVVGSSGSLLLHAQGPEIDAHAVVFRFNDAPTVGFERYAGARTTHRFTNLRAWGFHEGAEAVLVHTTTPQAVEGLVWNGQQAKPWNVWSFDPDFEAYLAHAFAFAPSQGLFGVVAALHTCRSVTVYGFGLSPQQGVLQRYYDPCQTLSNPRRVDQQWAAIAALAQAGLLQLGEPCTLECMSGPADVAPCAACRQAAGIQVPAPPACDDAARQQQAKRQYAVPWVSAAAGSGGGAAGAGAEAAGGTASAGSGTAGGSQAASAGGTTAAAVGATIAAGAGGGAAAAGGTAAATAAAGGVAAAGGAVQNAQQ